MIISFWGDATISFKFYRKVKHHKIQVKFEFRGHLTFHLNLSDLWLYIGCDSVHMSVPAEVAGDIHPQVPGAAEC